MLIGDNVMSYEQVNEEKRVEYIHDLTEKAKIKGSITYREVAEMLESVDMDKDQIDEVYENLMAIGIEVTSDADPEDFVILSIEHEEVEPDVDIATVEEVPVEAIIEAVIQKGFSVKIPERIYLKK